ncbi:MAG: hypothetical protein PVI89_18695, partial [Desulfobacteraceae bacterium]
FVAPVSPTFIFSQRYQSVKTAIVLSISGTIFASQQLTDWEMKDCPVVLVVVAIEGFQTYFIKTSRKNRYRQFSG